MYRREPAVLLGKLSTAAVFRARQSRTKYACLVRAVRTHIEDIIYNMARDRNGDGGGGVRA